MALEKGFPKRTNSHWVQYNQCFEKNESFCEKNDVISIGLRRAKTILFDSENTTIHNFPDFLKLTAKHELVTHEMCCKIYSPNLCYQQKPMRQKNQFQFQGLTSQRASLLDCTTFILEFSQSLFLKILSFRQKGSLV